MIARIVAWAVDNRLLVLLGTVLLVVWGLRSMLDTPVDALPDLSDVQVIVKTPYPGQAPTVVEDQVTYPIATALLSVPGAIAVRGYSFFGDSFVYVIFNDETDLYWARSRVLEYLNQVSARLPDGAQPTLGPDASGVGWVFEYALVDRTGGHDLAELRSLQDWFLRFELQTVPGVAEVATVGGMVRQYQVVVDPDRLSAFRLTLADVRRAIERGNQEVGASVIEMAEAEYMVRTTGYLGGMADLALVPLGARQSGVPITLADVAQLRAGPQMRRGIADLDGEGEVVGGIVVMRSGENALATIAGVKQRLAELAAGLPEGVEVVPVYDRSDLIERAVATLRNTLIEEFVVVALVCALFLFHLRSSLVVVLSLPVAILAAFGVMRLQGINANIMSLGGIAIAIGAMVDGAIVMVENAHQRLRTEPDVTGEARWRLLAQAAAEVGGPVFFSLLIITLSFLPVFALEAQEGRLFSPLAFTKTYAMAAAAILAVTLVPVLMGYCVRGRIARRNHVEQALSAAYRPALAFVVRHPWWVLAGAGLALVVGVWPTGRLGTEFMPPLDEGDLMYMPTTYPGISIDKARELLQQTDKLIRTVPEVRRVFGKIGRAETATDPAPLTMIETMIQLKPKRDWRDGVTLDDIRAELDRRVRVPGLSNTWTMPIKTRTDMLATGIKTPVGVKVTGADLEVIERIGEAIAEVLRELPATASVHVERVASGRYLEVDVDRRRAARYGLNIADVQDIVRTAVGGMDVTRTVEGLERYPVNLRYPQRVRDSVERLKLLPVITPQGARIALSDVADLRIAEGAPMIKSENGRPSGWIYVDIEQADLGGYVAAAQQAVAQGVDLPAGYAVRWAGQYEYLMRAQQRLAVVAPITLLIIVLLLYLALRQGAAVAIVLGTLPVALVGGVWTLYLLNYQLSVAVGVGFIALAGVAVELGVVMVTYLNLALRDRVEAAKREGRAPTVEDVRRAVLDGAGRRIRPVAMTAATLLAGLLPIMLGEGTGAEVMRRIAAPMFGGIVGAALLALAVVPALFLLWQERRVRLAAGGKTA